MSGNVVVAVRVRPLNHREINRNAKCIVRIHDNQTILTPPAERDKNGRQAADTAPKSFKFDFSYDSIDKDSPNFADQNQLYNDLGVELLAKAFDGYNCCIFAYGQTGSGKSYTMMGYKEEKGIVTLICEELFRRITQEQSEDLEYTVEVSYLEIYSEQVRDLLNPMSKGRLRIREHPVTGPYVEDLSKLIATNYGEIEKLMEEGNKARTVASTNMNEVSSRSHAVFSIVLTQKRLIAGLQTEKASKISLVDLAGSERANSTGATGSRLKEGAEINRSLSTLGRVISALADKSNRRQSMSKTTVPYRDSVLTWLLKDSLGGNSLTAMIATISPAEINYDETLSTLRYADSAKRIRNHAVVNEDQNTKMIRELKEELASLRAKLTTSDLAADDDGIPLSDQMISITASDGTVKQISKAEVAERMEQSAKLMEEINLSWEQKMENTQRIQRQREQALEELGIQLESTEKGTGFLGVSTPKSMPHLVNLSEDPLLTELLVYNLKPGDTLCGHTNNPKSNIKLSGRSIRPDHCVFENLEGTVSIRPMPGANVMVNGLRLMTVKRLRSGYRIILGDEALHVFRFNNPEEARAERDKLGTASSTASHRVRPRTSRSSLGSELVEEGRPTSSASRSTVTSRSKDNEYQAARREAAVALLKDANISDLADEEIEQLFDNLQRVRASRSYTRALSSQIDNYSVSSDYDVMNAESASSQTDRPILASDSSSVEAESLSSFLRNSGLSQHKRTTSSPLKPMLPEESEMTERERKRASDSERLVQLLNAARLEAEAKGEARRSSVIERLNTAKLDAERQLEVQQADFEAKLQALGNSDQRMNRLVRRACHQWRSLSDVSLAHTLLDSSVYLKMAQIMAVNLSKGVSIQFAIWQGLHLPISPEENDQVYETFQSEILVGSSKPKVVVRIVDSSRSVIYYWSLEKLRYQIKRMTMPLNQGERQLRPKEFVLFDKPYPKYSILGQASIPLIYPLTSERTFEIDVYSPHTHVHTGILQLQVNILVSTEDPVNQATIELRIGALLGISEKEATEIHLHAYLKSDPRKRLTTRNVCGFGDSPIRFDSKHVCPVKTLDLPDTMLFQVFGLAGSDLIDRLTSWDDLQESAVHPNVGLQVKSKSIPLHCEIRISEMDSSGIYAPCEVFTADKDDVGVFYLHQGLSRRIDVTFGHHMGSSLYVRAVVAMQIRNVATVSYRGRRSRQEVRTDAIDLKLVSRGTSSVAPGPAQELEDVVAQWDSSMHNTKSLDCTTPSEQVVVLTLEITLMTTQFGQIKVATDLYIRMHGRDQHPGYISRFLTSAKVAKEVLRVFTIPQNILEIQERPDLAIISSANEYVAGQEILGDWKPRGISLVQGYRKMLKHQARSMALQEVQMRYGSILTSMKSTLQAGTSRDQAQQIVRYWQLLARAQQSPDFTAQVIASYSTKSINSLTLKSLDLSAPAPASGNLHILVGVQWRKQYFVLQTPYLLQYSSSSLTKIISVLDLTPSQEHGKIDCKVLPDPPGTGNKRSTFAFYVVSDGCERRYQAPSAESRANWIAKINEIV